MYEGLQPLNILDVLRTGKGISLTLAVIFAGVARQLEVPVSLMPILEGRTKPPCYQCPQQCTMMLLCTRIQLYCLHLLTHQFLRVHRSSCCVCLQHSYPVATAVDNDCLTLSIVSIHRTQGLGHLSDIVLQHLCLRWPYQRTYAADRQRRRLPRPQSPTAGWFAQNGLLTGLLRMARLYSLHTARPSCTQASMRCSHASLTRSKAW